MRLSLVVLVLIVAGAVAAPWLAPHSPYELFLEQRLDGPSSAHLLGLDELGRDLLSRLLYGARTSLLVGIAVVALAASVGTALGALSGFAGGWIDLVLMRLTDLFLSFPGILLAIALVAILGPALEHTVLALALVGWVSYARLARGEVQRLREDDYIAAARASGVGALRILGRHLLPGVFPLLVVQASLGVAAAIVGEAGLSFLGLGVKPPVASWGGMIQGGRVHLLDAPHVAIIPGLALFLTVLALNIVGEHLAERLDD